VFKWLSSLKASADASAGAWVIECTRCGNAAPAREHGV